MQQGPISNQNNLVAVVLAILELFNSRYRQGHFLNCSKKINKITFLPFVMKTIFTWLKP